MRGVKKLIRSLLFSVYLFPTPAFSDTPEQPPKTTEASRPRRWLRACENLLLNKLEIPGTLYGEPDLAHFPWDQVQTALDESLARALFQVELLEKAPLPATFENTLPQLDRIGEDMTRLAYAIYGLHGILKSAESTQAMMSYLDASSRLQSALYQNKKIFERLLSIRENSSQLDEIQKRSVESTYQGFLEMGMTLDQPSQKRLAEIEHELNALAQQYSQNILKTEVPFKVRLSPEEQHGLPSGITITDGEIIVPPENTSRVLRALTLSEARRKVWQAMKASSPKPHPNEELIPKILKLRHEASQIKGATTYVHDTIKYSMIEDPQKLISILTDIANAAHAKSLKIRLAIKEFKTQQTGNDQIHRWDWLYWTALYKKAKFNFDSEKIRPYLELNATRQAVHQKFSDLFGITIRRAYGALVPDPSIEAYEVWDKNTKEFLGLIFEDLVVRPKRKNLGAWMATLQQPGTDFAPGQRRAMGYVVSNFKAPDAQGRVLLDITDLQTLLHEWGHALHLILSKTRYSKFAGTSVSRDFVELPSQVHEIFAQDPQFLASFAKHVDTGEPLPDQYMRAIAAQEDAFNASSIKWNAQIALQDLTLHMMTPAQLDQMKSLPEWEHTFSERWTLPGQGPEAGQPLDSYLSTFGHIFAGGYGAKYYSYLWSDVLVADALEKLQPKGIINLEAYQKFRKWILERGDELPASELYLEFSGQIPTAEAYIKRKNLH